jgi:hypothetical protein
MTRTYNIGLEVGRLKYYYVLVHNSMVKKKREEDKKLKITLSVDRNSFNKFKSYCAGRGMKVSSKIDLMMKREIENDAYRISHLAIS